MSSNGTRKETRGWEISSSGQMVNISTDDVAIEELPPSGPIVVNAGGTPPPFRTRRTRNEAANDVIDRRDGDAESSSPRTKEHARHVQRRDGGAGSSARG